MYSVLRVVLHDTFDYSTAPFSRKAGRLSPITRFNLRLLPTSRGRKKRFFFYLEKRKEVVIISDLRESSGGRFATTAHVEARFSCYFHILFTSRTLQNSHVKAFCFRKIFAHGKIKSGRKSLVKKKKKKKETAQRRKKGYQSVKKRKKLLWKWLVLAELQAGVQISNKEVAVTPKFTIHNVKNELSLSLCKHQPWYKNICILNSCLESQFWKLYVDS